MTSSLQDLHPYDIHLFWGEVRERVRQQVMVLHIGSNFNFSRNTPIFSMFQLDIGRFHIDFHVDCFRFRRVQLLSCPLLTQTRGQVLCESKALIFWRSKVEDSEIEIHKSTSSCTEQGDCTGAGSKWQTCYGSAVAIPAR